MPIIVNLDLPANNKQLYLPFTLEIVHQTKSIMDNQNQLLDPEPGGAQPEDLHLTPTIRGYWRESTQWALFFAILGFLYLAVAVVMLFLVSTKGGSFLPAIFGALIIGGFVFVPAWLIFQFSQKVKTGLETESSSMVALGFRNLRHIYQFAGIMVIVLLAFYAVVFLMMLVLMANR